MTENKITHRIRTAKGGIEQRVRDIGAAGPVEARVESRGPFDWLEHSLRGVFKH
ncbi:hypothetical protein K7711_43800 [Nocardia sp. CA2R105]|uniref:hypothetical protein n=1 Tax=Nocardia coffeae TaxID=2873381 RepID=UPI001CA6E8E3|nr:hypothetical protein [Nocardia coffeae]MBY8863457.1 hypothetical protein [Nocardia coffeae]